MMIDLDAEPVPAKHETKTCPRCGRSFLCKMSRVVHCDCMKVPLTPEALQLIEERYDDCLCVACLRILRREAAGGVK